MDFGHTSKQVESSAQVLQPMRTQDSGESVTDQSPAPVSMRDGGDQGNPSNIQLGLTQWFLGTGLDPNMLDSLMG